MISHDAIPNKVSLVFYEHGKRVARHPLPFLIAPLLIACLLSLGVLALEHNSDLEFLYVPLDSPALSVRNHLETTYSVLDDYSALRLTRAGGSVRLHIQSKVGDSIWNDNAFAAIIELSDFIISFTVQLDGETFTFADICATSQNRCVYTSFQAIVGNYSSVADLSIRYPMHGSFTLSNTIGDVSLSGPAPGGIIMDAGAVGLSFFLKYVSTEDVEKSDEWMNALRDELLNYDNLAIDVSFRTGLTINQEFEAAIISLVPVAFVS